MLDGYRDNFLAGLLLDALDAEGRVELQMHKIEGVERWRVEIKTDTFTVQAEAHHPFWTLMRGLGNLDERLKSARMATHKP